LVPGKGHAERASLKVVFAMISPAWFLGTGRFLCLAPVGEIQGKRDQRNGDLH
jgi:hypothetical protein